MKAVPARFRRRIALVTVGFIVLGWLVVLWQPRLTFWSPDCAAKFQQVAAIRFDHGLRVDVPYLGAKWDPNFIAVPLGRSYFDVRDGRIYMAWPELFPLLVSPFYVTLGWLGLFVVPIGAGAVALFLTGLVAERIRPGAGWLAALITAVATPVLCYSVLLWEHTLALALGMYALLMAIDYAMGARRWRVGAAAAALGLASAGLRGDMVLFAAAMFVAIFICCSKQERWWAALTFPAGFVGGAAPAWAMNLTTNGHIAPSNAVKNVDGPSLEYLRQAHVGILPHFFAGKRLPPTAAWMVVWGAIWFLALVWAYRTRGTRLFLYGALLAAMALGAGSLLCLDASRGDIFHGWLAMSPVLILGLLFPWIAPQNREHVAQRFVLYCVLAFAVANMVALGLTYPRGFASDGNMEWGPRYWLAIFPTAAVLAAAQWESLPEAAGRLRPVALLLQCALFLIGVDFTGVGLLRVRQRSLEQADTRALFREQGDVPLVTDDFWASPLAADQFARRPSFYIPRERPQDLVMWFRSAFAKGLSTFEFASSQGWPNVSLLREDVGCACVLTVQPHIAGDLTISRIRAVPDPEVVAASYGELGASHVVHGAIYKRYRAIGEGASYLGLPISDELPSDAFCPGGKVSRFAHGAIDWCPWLGAWAHADPSQGFPGRDY